MCSKFKLFIETWKNPQNMRKYKPQSINKLSFNKSFNLRIDCKAWEVDSSQRRYLASECSIRKYNHKTNNRHGKCPVLSSDDSVW